MMRVHPPKLWVRQNRNAWTAIHFAIRHRSLRCVLTYKSTLRALLATDDA